MTKIEIKPCVGIILQDIGMVKLGQLRSEVEKLIGFPTKSQSVSFESISVDQAFYDNYEFRIDYGKDNSIEFIEFIYGPFPERIELNLFGINPFKLDADELIKILTEKNSGLVDTSSSPYIYSFQNISVGIWRESEPNDIMEMIQEKKEDGEYESDKDWLNEELEQSKHFWTIGMGKKDYYK